jgi:transcriptional regulator with XRE-family HTH domain
VFNKPNSVYKTKTISRCYSFIPIFLSVKKQSRITPKRKKTTGPFANNLRAILEERGISQRGAAEIMGINVAVVNTWLQGTYPNDPNIVLKLCRALSCDFQWLLTGEQSQTNKTNITLSELFEIHNEPSFSGIFMVEAKRLKRRNKEET